jgi:hypothetical protein
VCEVIHYLPFHHSAGLIKREAVSLYCSIHITELNTLHIKAILVLVERMTKAAMHCHRDVRDKSFSKTMRLSLRTLALRSDCLHG